MMNVLGASNAVLGPTGTLGQLVDDSGMVKARVDKLAEQSSTGLVAQTYGGLGGTAQISLDLRPQLARTDVFSQNIAAAGTKLDVSSQVLTQLQQIATTFLNGTIGFATQTAQEVDTMAAQANAALTQVQSMLNTKVGQSYIFAGQDSANPPVPDTEFMAYVQSIKTAASGLAANGSTATIAATLSAATSGSPFSASLGTAPQATTVGFGITTNIGIVAGQNAFASQTGTGTTGSYVRDLIRSLATISAMSGSQTSLGTTFSNIVDDTRTSLGNQVTAINAENAGLGNSKQLLDMDQTTISDTQQAMNQQLSSVENVDAATAASELTQAQTQLQISYKLISGMQDLSLIHYL